MEEKFVHLAEYALRLIRVGLGIDPTLPKKPDDVEWKDLFSLAEGQLFTALYFEALKKGSELPPEPIYSAWENRAHFLLGVDARQAYAWEEIKEKFSPLGVKLLPLKGLHIKGLYPDPYVRQMGDLDILYEEEKMPIVRKGMKELGYSFQSSSEMSNHQVFKKDGVLTIEMHRGLLNDCYQNSERYYADPWTKAKQVDGIEYAFDLNDEYIYLLLHTAKHYYSFGNKSNVRSVVDFYLFSKRYGDKLDRDYIARELKKVDEEAGKDAEDGFSVCEAERRMERYASEWLGETAPVLSEDGVKAVFGRAYEKNVKAEERAIEQLADENKNIAGVFLKRAFLPYKWMRQRYPVLKPLPVLLPLFWVVRWVETLFRRPQNFKAERERLKKVKKIMKEKKNASQTDEK